MAVRTPRLFLTRMDNGHEVLAHWPSGDAGPVLEPGTRVELDFSAYDMSKARILRAAD